MQLANLGAYAATVAAEISLNLPDGIGCVLDERDLNLPGALLSIDAATFDRLDKQTLTITWKVFLIEREQSPVTALTRLGEMVATIQENLGIVATFQPEAISLPNHAADYLPAITFTFTDEIQP